jgi:hypothetical protein
MPTSNLFAPPSEDELNGIKETVPVKPSGKVDLFGAPRPEELSSLSAKQQEAIAQQIEQDPEMSKGEALLHGAEQGVTAGFFDEAQGGMEGLGTAIGLKGLGGAMKDIQLQKPNLDWEAIKKAYTERRDSERSKVHQAQNDHGGMFLAGNLAGALAIPGAGSIKGATALGAATGLGTSNADLTDGDLGNVGKAALDTGVGAATGFIAGKAGEKLGKMLTPEATQARAATRATKALGMKPLQRNLKVGQAALDEDALPMIGGSNAIKDTITNKIGELENPIREILKSVSENTGLDNVVKKQIPIENIVNELAEQSKILVPETSSAAASRSAIDGLAEHYGSMLQDAAGDPSKLNEIRKLIDEEAQDVGVFLKKGQGYSPELKPKARFLADLRSEVNDYLRKIASDVSTGAGEQLGSLMDRQSPLITAKTAASKLVEKDIVHPPGSIMDAIKNPLTNPRAFGVGAATLASNPIAKVGMGAVIGAEKLTQNPIGQLGNIASAKLQNQMAKGLNTTAGKMVSPAVNTLTSKSLSSSGVQSGIQSIYTINNDNLKDIADHFSQQKGTESLGSALNEAISNGDEDAKNRIIFAMDQRPDTRSQLKELMSMQKENTDLLNNQSLDTE